MAIDIGRIAYQKYFQSMDGMTEDVRGLISWEDLSRREKDAWRHAAVAVAQYLDEERKRYESEKDEDSAGFEIG